MFAMLFTIGTSYFLFVQGNYNSYVTHLVSRTNSIQGTVSETLQVTTKLTGVSGTHIGFYVNNTGGVASNLTAVLVLDKSGNMLQCDGIGLPSSAGCSNTTPALPTVINPGKGSALIDTGYTYSTGSTYTVKILTQAGNVFSAAYPPILIQSSASQTTGSLTVNLASFRWAALTGTSNIVQSNYLANCNNQNCGLQFQQSVTSADILVFALGWFGQSAPTKVSDSFSGDTFTLGPNQQVIYTPPATSVWNTAYSTSACSSGTCSLAFPKSVAAGDILVATLGWNCGNNNNCSPSSVHDSFGGDTYTADPSNTNVQVGGYNGNYYYSYIWYTTAASSASDTVTITNFGYGNTPSNGVMSLYELTGYSTSSVQSSSGSSSSSQPTANVGSFNPGTGANAVVIGAAETSSSTTFSAQSSYTLVATCSSKYGCSEYKQSVSSSTQAPMGLSPSEPYVETAISFAAAVGGTFYSYIWYATATQSGTDTITATFSGAVTGSVSIYELTGYTTTGLTSNTNYCNSACTTSVSVGSFSTGANSVVIGNTESSSSTTFGSSAPFTLINNCSPVYGCSEYATGISSGTTAPMTIGAGAPWVEAAIAFPTGVSLSSGLLVGGYPAISVPSQEAVAFFITFTNQDPQQRSVTLWPQSALDVNSIAGTDWHAQFTPFYIIDAINSFGNNIIAYNSTKDFVTLPYNVPTTLYFGAQSPLSGSTVTIDDDSEAPFAALFTLTGQFSDRSLYGQTIPFPSGIVTGANAYTSPVIGSTGSTITVSCNQQYYGCGFNPNGNAMIGWMGSNGQITLLTKFKMDGNGNIPSGTTFQVPSATQGYYTIIITDYVNTVFQTFQHL
jgi:hypothetical protein